ncbi:uncharacterized protein LOC114274560 [Camellia sinensis]|uniref:uncharacterized protein LOC114274560 n=1 Tax=Camellia sinensis TaxID=4442 RepID=UPI001035889C|nr:uncharacterized protein LOC114274560 [Camellia sinensis]
MHTAFAMKELGNISYFLGVSIKDYGDSYFLSQHKYASEILLKAGMANCKPCNSPSSVKPSLSSDSHIPFSQPKLYRSIVGSLQYLMITRPDLSLSVNQACQHMHAPTVGHFASIKRLLRFIQGTLTHGLTFNPSSFDLQAFSDFNWAGDVLDRRSTSGYCVYLGSNLISWSAKKQPTVSRSSTEAECRSLAHTAAKLTWLSLTLTGLVMFSIVAVLLAIVCILVRILFLGQQKNNPQCLVPPQRQNAGLWRILLLNSPGCKCCFVSFSFLPQLLQFYGIVDIFTKPLSVSRFQYLQAKLLVSPAPISLQEGDKTTTATIVAPSLALASESVATAPAPAVHSQSVTSRALYSQL